MSSSSQTLPQTPRVTTGRVPASTYRLQFSSEFRLVEAREIADYLSRLGVTAAYTSPLFRAREGSSHGYDVIDHSTIHPEFGTEDDFRALSQELSQRDLGLILDIVPNHMGIADANNRWWHDVLENGPSSYYAKCFDIDWNPPKQDFEYKVILPFLGDQYGRVLENQEIRLVHDDDGFHVRYYEWKFPLAPRSWRLILKVALEPCVAALEPDDPYLAELESIITSLNNLPDRRETNSARLQERMREKGVARRRLAALVEASPLVARSVAHAVTQFNGQRGVPESFDKLEELLADQAYRLCYWRVAMDEINYRRFFDINDLAAIRVEEPEVFQEAHQLVLRLLAQGLISGVRIDHVDGLIDPEQYLHQLQWACRQAGAGTEPRLTAEQQAELVASMASHPAQQAEAAAATGGPGRSSLGSMAADELPSPRRDRAAASAHKLKEPAGTYVLVEKILARDESLPTAWPAHGTTGYDFANAVTGVLVERTAALDLQQIYARFTGHSARYHDVIYESKKEIMRTSMTSELHVLARRLDRISEQHRYTRDFTLSSLQTALAEVVACFPVYRTYLQPAIGRLSDDDRHYVHFATAAAKRRNRAISDTIFDFIESVLLMDDPPNLSEEQLQERAEFILKFQQFSGPVMAKGLEDTAFYRTYPLASLNEVGGHPWHFGLPVERFHQENEERFEGWPYSMLATSTHDTKRSEDVRARINVLSEYAGEWSAALDRWAEWNAPHLGDVDSGPTPDPNEQYLFYQTLVGTWPLGGHRGLSHDEWQHYINRIVGYVEKACKEAKLNTSWLNQNVEHDQAVAGFIRGILDVTNEENRFPADMDEFVAPLIDAGLCNALAQVLLKIISPGVPDFYQGNELWEFTLVDPDNRAPVNYRQRTRYLDEIELRLADDPSPANYRQLWREFAEQRQDGRIKMLLTYLGLRFRRENPNLFLDGDYLPLRVDGPGADHLIGIARQSGSDWAVAVVPRCILGLPTRPHWPVGDAAWGDTLVHLPPQIGPLKSMLFEEPYEQIHQGDAGPYLRVAELFDVVPLALLG